MGSFEERLSAARPCVLRLRALSVTGGVTTAVLPAEWPVASGSESCVIGVLTVLCLHVACADETTMVSGEGVHASVRSVKCFGNGGDDTSCLAGEGWGCAGRWSAIQDAGVSAGCGLLAGMP